MTDTSGLRFDPNRRLIVVTDKPQLLKDEARLYGLTGEENMFIVVSTAADLSQIVGLPAETPWTFLSAPAAAGVTTALLNAFGPSTTFAYAVGTWVDEIAIHPSKLR